MNNEQHSENTQASSDAEDAIEQEPSAHGRHLRSWFDLFWQDQKQRQEFLYYGGVILLITVSTGFLGIMFFQLDGGIAGGKRSIVLLLLTFGLSAIAAVGLLYGVLLSGFMRKWKRSMLRQFFDVETPAQLKDMKVVSVRLSSSLRQPMEYAIFLWSTVGDVSFEEFVERWIVYVEEDLLDELVVLQGNPQAVISVNPYPEKYQRVLFEDGLTRMDGTQTALFGVVPFVSSSLMAEDYQDIKELVLSLPSQMQEVQKLIGGGDAVVVSSKLRYPSELEDLLPEDVFAVLTQLDPALSKWHFDAFCQMYSVEEILHDPKVFRDRVQEYLGSLERFAQIHEGISRLEFFLSTPYGRALGFLLEEFGYRNKKKAYESFVRSTIRLFRLFLMVEQRMKDMTVKDRVCMAILRNYLRDVPWDSVVLTAGPPRAVIAQLNLAEIIPDRPYLFFFKELGSDDLGESPYRKITQATLEEAGYRSFELCFIPVK